ARWSWCRDAVMTMTIDQDVEKLFVPTHAEASWRQAVAALDSRVATPIVIRVLQSPAESNSRRLVAATILGLLGDERAIPALVAATQAADSTLRGLAAETLGSFPRLGDDDVRLPSAGLGGPQRFFRECCARALGRLRRTEALPALEQMRDHDPAWNNREIAQEAIDAIRGG